MWVSGPRMSAVGAALKPVSCKFERAVAWKCAGLRPKFRKLDVRDSVTPRKSSGMSHVFLQARNTPQRRDCLAGVGGLELRNVVAKYPFERSHRFPGIQPNSGHRDYSRLSCGIEDTQLGPSARISAAACAAGG